MAPPRPRRAGRSIARSSNRLREQVFDLSRGAALLERCLGGLDELHDVPRQDRVAVGRTASAYAGDEVGELQGDRLGGVQLGGEDVARAIGQLVLPEGLGI